MTNSGEYQTFKKWWLLGWVLKIAQNLTIYLKNFSNSTVFKRNLIFAFLEAECYSWKEHKLVQESQFCHFSAALP